MSPTLEIRLGVRFRAIFDAAAIGMALADADGHMIDSNLALQNMLGYTEDELRTLVFVDYTHPDDVTSDLELFRELTARQRSNYQVMKRYIRKDTHAVWIRLSVSLIEEESKEGALAIFLVEDITDRKLAADLIQELNAELELRVRERTSQLELANRELEAFSYSVSHDLRAPLRAIDGFSQALLEDYAEVLDADGKEYLTYVRESCQDMAQLIDDLLRLSRVSRSELHLETVDLSALAWSITKDLQHMEPDRVVEVSIEEGLSVYGDVRLLRIALENVLGNAWKFTRHEPKGRIMVGAMQSDGRPVYFFRDNGAGFDSAYVEKLFGAFQRLHTTAEFEGTGIGLATVQRIVHRHGGRVWAEGEVGQGASIFFTLDPGVLDHGESTADRGHLIVDRQPVPTVGRQ